MGAEYDYEYTAKWQRLSQLRQSAADSQIVLLLGSSRSESGVCPAHMPALYLPDGRRQVVFNFGVTGGGPLHELVMFTRLLRAGVQVKSVLIEVLPPLLSQTPTRGEENYLGWSRLTLADLRTILPYCFSKRRSVRQWWSARRARIAKTAAKVPWHERWSHQKYSARVDAFGWQPFHLGTVTREQYRRGVDRAFLEYGELMRDFAIARSVAGALERLLVLCRRHSIRAALLLTPEGSPFRYWYSSAAETTLTAFLGRITARYGCSLIDARGWLPDESFADAHHLLPAGAILFSHRLAGELASPKKTFLDFD